MSAFVIVLVLTLNSQQTGTQARDAEAIAKAKDIIVRQIEPSLPDKAFSVWLQGLVGAQADIRWEVNDCGEQTGNPLLDKGRDFPMCAEAQVALGGKRKLHIILSVGTFKTGVQTGPASFFYAVVVEPDGSMNWVNHLQARDGPCDYQPSRLCPHLP